MTWVHLASPGHHPLSCYSISASKPRAVIRVKNGIITLQEGSQFRTISDQNPWEFVDRFLSEHRLPTNLNTPFTDGLIGYIGYEAGRYLETLPCLARDDLGLPDIWLMQPGQVEVRCASLESASQLGHTAVMACLAWSPNMSKGNYLEAVAKIKEHIVDGDIYQANFAQRFSSPFEGDAHALWQHLMQKNPAPFFAYIHDPEFQILCTSPERLLKQTGAAVESRPIKGTRPRGKSAIEDEAMIAELSGSEKEAAELAMIVDLVRNDLHRVCVTGSVQVSHHRMIEVYQNVFHQVSVITGKLPQQETMFKALAALFPGGSITGCPKIRAMEVIDTLEPVSRGVYTGSIGYASFHGTQDWNIAIRTAVVKNGKIHLSVGGGIVADSNPHHEYEETLHKAATFFSNI